jgi:hypothetical protein
MPNEPLIDALAADLAPVRPRRTGRELLALAGIGAVELTLVLLLGGARPDIGVAMLLPSFWWKLLGLAALSAIGVVTAVRSFEPASSPRRGLLLLALAVGFVLAVGWAIDGGDAVAMPLAERLMWRHGVDCVFRMAVLSVPAIVALGLLMQRGAPTDRRASALAVGAASAAWGAFVFAFNCPSDDPLYIAFWYCLGCAVVTLIGRLALPAVTRW